MYSMSKGVTILIGLISGATGAVGGVWLLRSFLGAGIEHFFAIALQNRARLLQCTIRQGNVESERLFQSVGFACVGAFYNEHMATTSTCSRRCSHMLANR